MHIENPSLVGDDEQHDHIPSPPSLILSLSLPSPSAATRSVLARSKATEAMRFASRLGVTVTGIDALVASLPAPGPDAAYIGVRGLQHYVEQQVFDGIADALTRNAQSVNVGPAADESA